MDVGRTNVHGPMAATVLYAPPGDTDAILVEPSGTANRESHPFAGNPYPLKGCARSSPCQGSISHRPRVPSGIRLRLSATRIAQTRPDLPLSP